MRYFIQGFLPGLFVGAALAFLFTPRPGPETRELVRQRVQAALEAGRQATQERREELRARYRQKIGAPSEE